MSAMTTFSTASFIAYGLLLCYRDSALPLPTKQQAAAREEEPAAPATRQRQQARVASAAAHVVVQICNA